MLTAQRQARRRLPTGPILVVGILAVALLVFGFGPLRDLLPDFANPFSTETQDRTGPAVLEALEDVSEYDAATGHFQVIVDIEEDAGWVPDFLRGERTVMTVGGDVDASVDFAGLTGSAIEVSEDGESVRITLPPARLEEPHIDPDDVQVVSQDRGLLDRVGGFFSDNSSDTTELYQVAEDKLASAADDAGLTERAEENTRAFLEGLMGSLGFSDVTVVFEADPT